MDYIQQYLQLMEVKPDYHKLNIPFDEPSRKKFVFNVEEIELWYDKEFGVLKHKAVNVQGGTEGVHKKVKVIVLDDSA